MRLLTAAQHPVRITYPRNNTFDNIDVFVDRPKTAMEWTESHDVIMCREMRSVNPFQANRKTTQRTKMWETIVLHLEKIESPAFKVTVRSVRDRYNLISRKYRKRMNDEVKASGISPNARELDTLLEELTELEDLSEQEKQEGEEKVKKIEEDKVKAQDVRKQAMEKLSETKKRKPKDEDDMAKKKSRKSPSDTIAYLREKSDNEMEIRKQELEEDRKKQEEAHTRNEMLMRMILQQNQAMMQMMNNIIQK